MDGVVAAALPSAFRQAAWNAAVRAASDPRGAMAAQVVAAGLLVAPLLLVLPLPSREALRMPKRARGRRRYRFAGYSTAPVLASWCGHE